MRRSDHPAFLLLLLALAWPAAASPQKPIIFYLNSYHIGYAFSDDEMQGFRDGLGCHADGYDLRVKFLDAKHDPDHSAWPSEAVVIRERLEGTRPALLVAADNDAYDFMRRYRAALFGKAPLVFCGINDWDPSWLDGMEPATGVLEWCEYLETLDAGAALFPGRTHVLYITDETTTGKAHVDAMMKDLARAPGRYRLEAVDLSRLTWAEASERLRRARSDELVLFLAAFKDRTGVTASLEDALQALIPPSAAPVLVLNEPRIRSGALGGKVVSALNQGRAAAAMGLQLLSGAPAASLPISGKGSSEFLWDEGALKRWRVRESLLPKGSRVIHRMPTWWSEHGNVFIAALATALGTALVLGLFVVNIERRRRAERRLLESESRMLSEKLEAEKQRLVFEAKVLQAQKLESLGVLAGGIAHDFNNLLTAILGNADLALGALPPGSPLAHHLEGIETASRRAGELCRQLLAYSGKGRFVVQPLDLAALVREMGELLSVSISKRVRLVWDLAPGLPMVEADASQMRQVVMNLITNASEAYAEGGGTIILKLSREAEGPQPEMAGIECVQLEVSDSGSGMDGEALGRIFDPFYTTKFTGRGLGLAAVLGIVRGHKGAIRVTSTPGKGSAFKLFFPARVEGAPPALVPAPETPSWNLQGTVLLVDDEEAVRSVGRAMLERAGLQVLGAADGAAALEAYKAHPGIGCVVLDLTMPDMDGETCFRELRRIDPQAKIVLSSGYNEQDVMARFAGKGQAGFVQKPYKTAELLAKVKAVMEGTDGGDGKS